MGNLFTKICDPCFGKPGNQNLDEVTVAEPNSAAAADTTLPSRSHASMNLPTRRSSLPPTQDRPIELVDMGRSDRQKDKIVEIETGEPLEEVHPEPASPKKTLSDGSIKKLNNAYLGLKGNLNELNKGLDRVAQKSAQNTESLRTNLELLSETSQLMSQNVQHMSQNVQHMDQNVRRLGGAIDGVRESRASVQRQIDTLQSTSDSADRILDMANEYLRNLGVDPTSIAKPSKE